jgi:hypothetical protein
MKIEELQRIIQTGTQKSDTEKIEADRSFEAVLNETAAERQGGASGVGAGEGPPPSSAPLFVSTVPDLSASEAVRDEALQKLEMTLALLEQYHDELLDPTKTLKALANTVELLKNEVSGLQKLLLQDPMEVDLKEIIHQTAIQTQVEVTRFDQGILL